jgi:hypothetical protein
MQVLQRSKTLHLALLLLAVPFAASTAQTTVTQNTVGGGQGNEDQSGQDTAIFATQPGVGVGLSVGFDGQVSSSIQNSLGYEGYLRYGTSFGLFLLGGIHISTHNIDQASPSYRLTSFFFEPRFVALNLSPRLAPFISGRLAFIQEGVDQPGAEFKASGYSLGGGLGAVFQLMPQVALEGAFNLGVATLGGYVFRGESAWYNCLQDLEPGTSLPETVVRCDGSSGGPVYSCYPPFFEEYAGNCSPPEIPYEDSGRSTTWFQMRLGIQLSIATP